MSARRHPASLLPIALHNPQLLSLVREHVTYDMVLFVAQQTVRAVPLTDEPAPPPGAALPTPPHTPLKAKLNAEEISTSGLPPLAEFIAGIVDTSRVQIPVLLATVLFLERLRLKLPKVAKGARFRLQTNIPYTDELRWALAGLPCTRHRVFLATLIVAAKYLNDSSPKNKHWAIYARLFDINEINLMEKQLLFLLDYDLRFDEADALSAFYPFLRNAASPCIGTVSTRQKAVNRVAEASKARVQAQLPPTPPHELDRRTVSSTYAGVATSATTTAAQTLATTVNSIARRLSKTYLGGGAPQMLSTPAKELSARTSSATSTASGAESETSMGALTEDTGSATESSSSDELLSEDDMEDDEDELMVPHSFPFTLQSVPALARRRTRKASDTVTIAAHDSCSSLDDLQSVFVPAGDSIHVIKQNQPEPIPAPTISNRRSLRLRRATLVEPKLVQSRTMPALTSPSRTPAVPPPSIAGSFLSRVWGVATKGSASAAGAAIDVATEPEATQRGLRRLAHSRSTMFRGTQHNMATELGA